MSHLESIAGRPGARRPWAPRLLAAVLLLGASAAQATPIWQDGDLTTYGQFGWSDDPTASSLLTTDYDTVYAPLFDVVEIGLPGTAGFSAQFTDWSYVLAYLPAVGPSGALDADLSNPTSTSAGSFGGVVLALRLNIDFSDAGDLSSNAGLPFGDLTLCNMSVPALDGQTVRDLSSIANTLLGGGSDGYSITDIGLVVQDVNLSFNGGLASAFAQDHLRPPGSTTTVPEPPTLALLGVGLLGLGRRAWRRRWDDG